MSYPSVNRIHTNSNTQNKFAKPNTCVTRTGTVISADADINTITLDIKPVTRMLFIDVVGKENVVGN